MNTHPCEYQPGGLELLLEVDFKWLMAGQGRWVDPQRLHSDPLYARGCLQSAIESPCDALQRCARYLQAQFSAQP